MEENYNSDPGITKTPKTSSTDGKKSNKTTGDSEVQTGEGVVDHEVERPYEKGDDQQEYIEQANNNTEVANESPVKNGKNMTMAANTVGDEIYNSESDNQDDLLTETVIGDDANEAKNNISIM